MCTPAYAPAYKYASTAVVYTNIPEDTVYAPGSSSASCCSNGSVGLNWPTCIGYVEVWELKL